MSLSKPGNLIQNNDLISGRKLLVALIASIVTSVGMPAQSQNAQPKLVVGIMVEDLQNEYIKMLRENFSDGGFNRLIEKGIVIPNIDYGAPLDAAASTAIIFTGAEPSVNGIPSAEVFDMSTLRGIPVLHDESTPGNYTSQKLSPSAITVTTLADEVRIAGGGVTYVYSIANDPTQAIIMSGHAGNCAIWLNNANASWATSSYYRDVPSTLGLCNRIEPLRTRIDTMAWTPLLSKDKYSLLSPTITTYPFKHVFRQDGPEKILAYRNSPKANEETTKFAIENIKQLRLGQHDGADMLNVAFSLEPYAYSKLSDNRYEIFDSYYRLDKNLEQLFKAIDDNVGMDNAVIFLAATPPVQRTKRDDEKWQLPYGEFSTRKAISLLNLYLIAKYGNGEWVQAYHNGQFFLNQKLAEQQKKDISEIRHDAARFLERMAGVNKTYTIDEILDADTPETAAIRRNTVVNLAGDVRLSVLPGWEIIDDFNNSTRTQKVERSTAATAPAFILAPGITPKKIDQTIDARSIAPTITRLLRIRSPNGACAPALDLE